MSITSITPYATPTEGDQYMADRLYTEAWDEAGLEGDAKLWKALKQATRNINRLNFRGYKYDFEQVNAWPRVSVPNVEDGTTPEDIKVATIELAYSFLDGREAELEYENLQANNEGYVSVRRTYDRRSVPPHIVALIPSAEAWALLKPYLSRSGDILISRA